MQMTQHSLSRSDLGSSVPHPEHPRTLLQSQVSESTELWDCLALDCSQGAEVCKTCQVGSVWAPKSIDLQPGLPKGAMP